MPRPVRTGPGGSGFIPLHEPAGKLTAWPKPRRDFLFFFFFFVIADYSAAGAEKLIGVAPVMASAASRVIGASSMLRVVNSPVRPLSVT